LVITTWLEDSPLLPNLGYEHSTYSFHKCPRGWSGWD